MTVLPTSPALLLVDLQNDYLKSPELDPHRSLITDGAARLLESARSNRVPVVHVWTTVRESGDDRMPHWKTFGTWKCIEGTAGHLAPVELTPVPGELIVHKTFFSGFSNGSLDEALRRLRPDVLVLAGLHLHACMRATALDAYQRGFETWIAKDATGSDDPLHSAITRRYLEDRSTRFISVDALSRYFADRETRFIRIARARQLVRMGSPGDPGYACNLPIDGGREVSGAVEKARSASTAVRSMTIGERAQAVLGLADDLGEASGSLIADVVAETGKPIKHAKQELAGAERMLRMIAARIAEESGCTNSVPRVRYRPLGTVAVISSWNNPVYIPLGKVIPALCYGNTVIWKPAEAGTGTAKSVQRLLLQRFPANSVRLVTGNGETGRLLISSPGVDGVSFTGSLATGRLVQEVCTRRFIPLQAELGGNNAAIVMDDCDVKSAAGLIAHGAFAQAGQRCTATRRAVVMRSILGEFVDYLKEACSRMVWGDPGNETVDIGPLISCEQKLRVQQAVVRAEAQGCDLLYLRTVSSFNTESPRDYWLPPVVVFCTDPGMEIAQEELFGPVLVIQAVDSFEQAIGLCNGVRQGLAASIFTSSKKHTLRFLDQVEAGILKVNLATDSAEPDVPFGGWKASGMGPAEHGASDREFYTRVQAVYAGNAVI